MNFNVLKLVERILRKVVLSETIARAQILTANDRQVIINENMEVQTKEHTSSWLLLKQCTHAQGRLKSARLQEDHFP